MNTTLKGVLTLTLFINTFLAFAQQEPTSTLFWNNYLHTNPAMTGAVYKHQANLTWRNYAIKKAFQGPDYPQTIFANYALKLDKIHSGIGISYRYDSPSYQLQQTGLVSYAYHIPIKSMFLSFGISGGIKTLNSQIPNSSGELITYKYKPGFTSDFGIALRHEKWNVGASLTQWNGPVLHLREDSLGYGFKFYAHFWFFADYRFALGENWSLTPRFQLVMDRVSMLGNLQLIAAWKENLWFGAGVQRSVNPGSSGVPISPSIGYDIKGRFRLGYTAIISVGRKYGLNIFNPVTHEAVLGFMLK